MAKQSGTVVTLVRGGVLINALVAVSHDVYTPATQTEKAFTTEHLTLVYLEPGAPAGTGEALRASIKTQIDVPPVDSGQHFGWEARIDTVAEPTKPPTLPSAADLDAVAAEQALAAQSPQESPQPEATSTEALQSE
jgi:hypothetical protein